jgi:organic radical activating enzyme
VENQSKSQLVELASSLNTWCPYPFHYAMVTPNLDVRPCCRYDSSKDSKKLNIESLSEISAVIHGSSFSMVRNLMSENREPDGCQTCYREERSQILSLRQKTILEKSLPHTSSVDLTSMEIGVGRLCNLKCRTCNSQYSTKWDQDEALLGLQTPLFSEKKESDLENFPADLFSTLVELKVTGGEPFLSKSFETFLQNFKLSGFSKNCSIEIFTNCSFFPSDRILTALDSFKSCRISLSIDGLSQKNDYIRHPSQWKNILASSSLWREWESHHPSRSLWIANTVCVLNIADSFLFLDWSEKHFGKKSKVVFQILHGPAYLSVFNLPAKMKSQIKEHLQSQLALTLGHLQTEKHQRNIAKILSLLSSPSTRETQSFSDQFLFHTTALDKIRNEDFKTVFPEFSDWLTQC